MRQARLFKKLPQRAVMCQVCQHYCRISPGKTGRCGVRQNRQGELYLLVYGQTTGIQIDPIEKKPLYHFLPGRPILSLGTLGCNFRCGFCQNWLISQAKANDSRPGDDYWEPRQIVNYCHEKQIPAIAFTYNEPTVFIEYALATMNLAKKAGLKTVWVSNGFQSPQAVAALKGRLDAINIDLKSLSEKYYQRICRARLAPVLANIKKFHQLGVWVEVTTLIVPAENDSEGELRQIAQFLLSVSPDIPWHVSRFHPDFQMTDKPLTPTRTLKRALEIGQEVGLKYLYAGNIEAGWGQNTNCPNCGIILIKRQGYHALITNDLVQGSCLKCGAKIKGVWQ